MKISICLYGQARDHIKGYNNLNNMIINNNDCVFDVFFHCWIDQNIKYEVSPWRKLDPSTLLINNAEDVKNDLLSMYKPILYRFDKPMVFDLKDISKTECYINLKDVTKKNVNNTLSQFYSRNKVRDLFKSHCEKGNNYDMVITTRFDFLSDLSNLKLNKLNKDNIYVNNMYYPRRVIIPDNFIICPQETYIKWFDIYDNIISILSDKELAQNISSLNEGVAINPEELVLSSFVFKRLDFSKVVFTNIIPPLQH